MEKEQIKFGITVKHKAGTGPNGTNSKHHSDNLYIVADISGKAKVNGEWLQYVEYINTITGDKYYREINDFADKFYLVDSAVSEHQVRNIINSFILPKINNTTTTFDFLRNYINYSINQGKTLLQRSDFFKSYREYYNVNYVSGTMDQYRRMYTTTGFLSDTDKPGVYQINKVIPQDLTVTQLTQLYKQSFKSIPNVSTSHIQS